MNNLTEFFNSLPSIDREYNKYASYSLAFNNPYKLITGYDAFKYDKFEPFLRNFIIEQEKCIVMPNYIKDEVISLVLRSCTSKQFRYHHENGSNNIPYGAGVNSKQYYQPWLIVESALDSDFIRNFYPYTIATNGVSVSRSIMEFITGTSSTIYCGFDNDDAGNEAFHNLCKRYSGKNKTFHIRRFSPPMSLDGTYLKDFGEIIECLYKKQLDDYDYYVMALKNLLLTIQ